VTGLSSDSDRLFLPDRREVRLPCTDLAIRRGSDHLGFFLLWLLGFAVASLLALGHDVLLALRFEPVRSVRDDRPPLAPLGQVVHFASHPGIGGIAGELQLINHATPAHRQ
jgi:hypothetical protein